MCLPAEVQASQWMLMRPSRLKTSLIPSSLTDTLPLRLKASRACPKMVRRGHRQRLGLPSKKRNADTVFNVEALSMLSARAAAVMTPADQAIQEPEAPFSIRRRQRGGRRVVAVSSSVSAMDALRARIRAQSKTVADHIAADPEAQGFIDD